MSAQSPASPSSSSTSAPSNRHRIRLFSAFLLALAAGLGMAAMAMTAPKRAPVYGFKVIKSYPHDPKAFSQGLVAEGDTLYEGTGREGESTLRLVDLNTGKIKLSQQLDNSVFGEGITVLNDKIYQLTWKHQTGFIYDKASFKYLNRFRYSGEGWGLTHDGKNLIMSDGSSILRFLDPKTFKVVRRLQVRDRGQSIDSLNELEYVEGEIYANIWYRDVIARISPKTGAIVGWIDLNGIISDAERGDREHVLNGIAYDPQAKRLFVTGKNWPKLYEISLVPPK